MEKNSQNSNYANTLKNVCGLPEVAARPLDPGIDVLRESFIRRIEKTWVNGSIIKYCFMDHHKGHGSPEDWTGSVEDIAVVKDAFHTWKNLGIGLSFKEVFEPVEADVRIGFKLNDGSWSYLGTDVRNIAKRERTMNFGWPLSRNQHGIDTALHEIGHTLGAPHEHQNPNAGIEWNREAVYTQFQAPPNNWSRAKIDHNILNKIPSREVSGSNWDPESIMHYQFGDHLIDAPSPYNEVGIFPPGNLSNDDKKWVKKFYPPQQEDNYIELKPYNSSQAVLEPGDQLDFIIRSQVSRRYTLQTFGRVDTLLVLFEKDGNEEIYLAGDDDSGYGRNALIRHRLIRGREYILRLRFYYSSQEGDTAVMLW